MDSSSVARRARVAADRRRRGDGERRGAEELPHAGAKGLRDWQERCAISASASYGVVRIDSASSPADWAKDPEGNTRRIAETFREACDIAEGYGERLAAEGEICWGGMHSWKRMVQLLEMVNRPKTLGYQADMAHNLLFTMGYNAPEDRLLPEGYDWTESRRSSTRRIARWRARCARGRSTSTSPRTTPPVKGSGSHDKTGRHCLPDDPNGKLDVVRYAGFWLRDDDGKADAAVQHICWDGCMFSNDTMMQPQTWNDVLKLMIDVRNAHGWNAPVAVAV